jgi:hypothetical protein
MGLLPSLIHFPFIRSYSWYSRFEHHLDEPEVGILAFRIDRVSARPAVVSSGREMGVDGNVSLYGSYAAADWPKAAGIEKTGMDKDARKTLMRITRERRQSYDWRLQKL